MMDKLAAIATLKFTVYSYLYIYRCVPAAPLMNN